jgi:hypothetical protein
MMRWIMMFIALVFLAVFVSTGHGLAFLVFFVLLTLCAFRVTRDMRESDEAWKVWKVARLKEMGRYVGD